MGPHRVASVGSPNSATPATRVCNRVSVLVWTGIVLGVLATAVFVAMLATSTDRARRVMGPNWKRLPRLMWFAVPLALAHTILASGPDSPSILLYLGIVAFAAFECLALRRRGTRGAWTHVRLVGAGMLVAALV